MDPAAYDRWYEEPRGARIGARETALILAALRPRAGETLLDAGCGTGYFARALAAHAGLRVTGADRDPAMLAFARARGPAGASWLRADLRALPFADAAFDHAIAIAALCFVPEERDALRELLRVARRRFAIGLLHRPSLLHLRKGRDGGSGGYRGARWHRRADAARLFDGLPVRGLRIRTPILLSGGGFLLASGAVEPRAAG
jgi:SAM-dependent methyltransferase